MPAKHSRHIGLTDTLATWIVSPVTEGVFASTSDPIRTAVWAPRSQDEGNRPVERAVSMRTLRGKGQA
ncbi:type II toxin-antitoxin system ParD family antitoxin [Methylobacterium soli]|uniref:Type II toxin-antitoxin system ParD family antitoxin n=1 Tax=Methylobacterium soli TaxID=553447 RepID=A0A6L3T1T3_9HYPH|nr:type II toxin-antitoxin system ParD family antitoxin [Methylobacterium soli]KAB1080590.1 type II toxin-antitoxin system ParD family antitoxin [Methylobacterium soli]GJE45087.1 hypothetical protein AEGHOMDF_4281 [Methylobacterium soli]